MRAVSSAWRIAAVSRWKSSQHCRHSSLWGGEHRIPAANPNAKPGLSVWRGFAQAAELKEEVELPRKDEEEDEIVRLCKTHEAPGRIKDWISAGHVLTDTHISKIVDGLIATRRFRPALRVLEFVRAKTNFVPSNEQIRLELLITARDFGATSVTSKFSRFPESLRTNEEVIAAYIAALARVSATFTALDFVKGLKEPKTAALLSSILSLYSILNMHDKMMPLYAKMKKQGLKPTLEAMLLMLLKYHKRLGGPPEIEEDTRAYLAAMDFEAVKPQVRNHMLEMYGYLGDRDKVEKIWSSLTRNSGAASLANSYLSGMAAFSSLGDVEKAEELLEESVKRNGIVFVRNQYFKMMDVYARHGMMDKAEKVFKETECDPYRSFYPFNALVEGYLNSNNIEKALERLNDAYEVEAARPTYEIVTKLLEVFASRADVSGARKMISAYLLYYRGDVLVYNKLLKVYIAAEMRPGPKVLEAFDFDPSDETRELLKAIEELPVAAASEDLDESLRKVGRSLRERTQSMPPSVPPMEMLAKRVAEAKRVEEAKNKKSPNKAAKWDVLGSLV